MESQTPINPTLPIAAAVLEVKDHFDEIFSIEIECWCYGFTHFRQEISAGLVHRVIKELTPAFRNAILHDHIFDLAQVAKKIAQASGSVVSAEDIALSILLVLPVPYDLDEDAQFVLAQIVDQGEHFVGPVLAILESKWKADRQKVKRRPKTVRVSNRSRG